MGLLDATVSFPNLGIEIEKMNKYITVFGFDIAFYGIIIGIGMLVALTIVLREAKITGQDTEEYIDFAIFTLLMAIIGARLYYVIFSFDNYKDNLVDIFKIREGGLAIYGGIIGGALAIFIMCKFKNKSFLKIADSAVLGLVIGQAIGRWGNFVNREAYGKSTDSLFAMKIDTWSSGIKPQDGVEFIDEANRYIQVHPTFLYESAWNLVLFAVLMLFRKKKKYHGEVMLWYLCGYGIGRSIIEGIRTDQLKFMNTNIAVSQVLSMILALTAGIIIVVLKIKKKDAPSVWGDDKIVEISEPEVKEDDDVAEVMEMLKAEENAGKQEK